jgi:uncharacterized membrane protein
VVVEFMPVLSGFLSVYTAALIYRSFVPRQRVEWALEVARSYRLLEEEARRSKRAARKAKKLLPEYRRARSIIFRTLLLKLGLLMLTYTLFGVVAITSVPALPAPLGIPVLTVEADGVTVMPSIHIHLASFAFTLLLLKDELV